MQEWIDPRYAHLVNAWMQAEREADEISPTAPRPRAFLVPPKPEKD
ncbi:hypothetical protein AB0A69_19550 [Streptomyces sp. NPDC045431]